MNPAIEYIRALWGADVVSVPPSPDTVEQAEDSIALFGVVEYIKPSPEDDSKVAAMVGTIEGVKAQIQSLKEAGHPVGMIFFWEPEPGCIRSLAVETKH